jgi:hypothetical protein
MNSGMISQWSPQTHFDKDESRHYAPKDLRYRTKQEPFMRGRQVMKMVVHDLTAQVCMPTKAALFTFPPSGQIRTWQYERGFLRADVGLILHGDRIVLNGDVGRPTSVIVTSI